MAFGDALAALRAEIWKNIEDAQNRMDRTEGEAHTHAKVEREFLLRFLNRLLDVTEATTEELRTATEKSRQRSADLTSQVNLLDEATARIQQLESERHQWIGLVDISNATVNEAAEAIQEITASWQTLMELEAAVIANPLDGAAKRRRDTFIQRKFYEQLHRN